MKELATLKIQSYRSTGKYAEIENSIHFELHSFRISRILAHPPAALDSVWLDTEIHVTPCFGRHVGEKFRVSHTANSTLGIYKELPTQREHTIILSTDQMDISKITATSLCMLNTSYNTVQHRHNLASKKEEKKQKMVL